MRIENNDEPNQTNLVRKTLKKIALWPYSSKVAAAVVTTGNIIGGFSLKNNWGSWTVFWYCIAFLGIILTVVFDMTKDQTIKKLKDKEVENELLQSALDEMKGEFKMMLSTEIRRVANELEFNGLDRISVHTYENGEWKLLDRYAHNAIDFDKRNNISIPNCGFLKMAYKSAEGYYYWNRKFSHPSSMKKEMERILRSEDCFNEFCQNVSMNSRTYFTHAISTTKGRSTVLTVESTDYERWPLEKIKPLVQDSASRLGSFVNKVTPIEKVDLAKNIGL